LYDGWWTEGEYRPIDDAIYEALYGSQLLKRPQLPASADREQE
jgi:hypothetical protein